MRKSFIAVAMIVGLLSFGGTASASSSKFVKYLYCTMNPITRTPTVPSYLSGSGWCFIDQPDSGAIMTIIGLFSGKWVFVPTGLPGAKWGVRFFWTKPYKPGSFQLAEEHLPLSMPLTPVVVKWQMTLGAGTLGRGQFTLPAINLLVTSNTLATGLVNKPFSYKLKAKLGTAPYAWHKISGLIPVGLKINTDGIINGVPRTPGIYTVRVGLSDHDHRSASFNLTLRMNQAPGESS